MRLAKFLDAQGQAAVGIVEENAIIPLRLEAPFLTLAAILNSERPGEIAAAMRPEKAESIPLQSAKLLAPIDQQEVWAAGVTYKRSRTARMEESEAAASCYDRVYVSDRPELFFKATVNRVSGPGAPLRIRYDSKWDVPEPELALVISPAQQIVGYTIGNDMSSREIEGENPLYLPQAKVYRQCCGLGPWVTLPDEMPTPSQTGIQLEIQRKGAQVFAGSTSVSEMARSLTDLVSWLFRENEFPSGVVLLTGTGIVPDHFTLEPGDVVAITIDGIGTLRNPIVRG
jgi:2-dehydro-3-deoxy-D-arabinonate dehydratase